MATVIEMDINAETVKLADRMDALYTSYKEKKVKREEADSLANIAGKHLKAVQINLANRIFGAQLESDLERLTRPEPSVSSSTQPRLIKGKAASAGA